MPIRYFIKQLLLPPGLFLLLLAFAWWFRRSRPRLAGCCFALGLGGMWLMSLPVMVEWGARVLEREPPLAQSEWSTLAGRADAIVVLGSGRERGDPAWGSDQPTGIGLERQRYAARLAKAIKDLAAGSKIGVDMEIKIREQAAAEAAKKAAGDAEAVGREKGTVTEEYYREVAKGLLELPAVLEDVLGLGDRIADLSKIFTYAHNFIYLGRGYNYPTALEGALKLKEISYIHAEGYPAAEMKHGAIALIDNEMPTVAIATPDNTYEKTASNIEEIRARGGKIIAVIARDDTHVRRSADYTIEVPVVTDCLMPIVVSVPLQLLAYYIAVNKGRNVDQPRNLAKSVTVE